MRGDFLQGAGGYQSGCLQAFDDSLDLSQARLEGVDLFPQFFQLLSEDFALTALGSHDGYPILRELYPFFEVLGTVRVRSLRSGLFRLPAETPPRASVGDNPRDA